MGYFPDVKDFSEMSGAELAAELRAAEKRAETGATARDRSAGELHADVVRLAIFRYGLRPELRFKPRSYKRPRKLIPAVGQYEDGTDRLRRR